MSKERRGSRSGDNSRSGASSAARNNPANVIGRLAPQSAPPTDLMKLTPQEYLDKFSVTAYLKDVTTLLLENRPTCPIAFITDYFRNVIQGTSPLVRSYRYIRLTSLNRQSFWDNLVAAYSTLDERKGGGVGITGADMRRLLHLLCVDFPPEIVTAVLEIFEKTETCVVPFKQFAAGIYACLEYEQFFGAVERLFVELDTTQSGSIPVALLSEALMTAFYEQRPPSHDQLPQAVRAPVDLPQRVEVLQFIDAIETPEVTFKQLMKKIFALTDPGSARPTDE